MQRATTTPMATTPPHLSPLPCPLPHPPLPTIQPPTPMAMSPIPWTMSRVRPMVKILWDRSTITQALLDPLDSMLISFMKSDFFEGIDTTD